MKKSKFLAKLLAGVMLVTSLGAVNVSAISQASTANRENNVITEFGNTTAIAGLTYCDSVGYNSTSSVRYTKTAEENTADTNLVMPENLGLEVGKKYSFSFYIKPVQMDKRLWIRMNGTTNGGAGSIAMSEGNLIVKSGESCTKIEDAGDGWYKVYSPTANEHKIGWSGMAFLLATSGAAVDFYIDNLSITDENGNEVIKNGGFEIVQQEEEEEVLRDNNVIKEFGNSTEIAGLRYSDSVGYESTSSVRYQKSAEENTSDVSLVMHPNLGMVEGNKYSFSFYIKPVTMTSLWIRINGTTNGGAGSIGLNGNGALTVVNGPSFMTITSVGNGWYKVASNTANEHKIAWGGMALLFATKGAAVDFYIDNFSITDESGNELVVNGGFEYQEPEEEPEVEQVITRTDNIVTELGNTIEVNGLTYSDTVGYNSKSSVHYAKTADENTADINLAMPANLGMVEGTKYSFSFYIKPIAMTSLWIRINGTTNGGAGAIKFDANGALVTENAKSFMSVTSAGDGWYKVASNTANEHKIGWSGMALLLAGKGGAVDFYIDNFSIKDENGTEMVTNGGFELPKSQVGDFVMTDNGDGTKTVTVTVANRAAGSDYTALLILATFDGDVMNVIKYDENATTVTEGKKEILSQTIAVNEGESMKAYVWDSINGMNPLTFSRELVSAE